jgi:mono/diheme cytochrome c family protein
MKIRKIIIVQFFVLTLAVILAGCTKKGGDTSNLYVPSAADVTATATLQELQQGRVLYIDNCGSCHGFYNPDSFNTSQWSSIMNSMGPKTGMTGSESQLVKKYVTRGKS